MTDVESEVAVYRLAKRLGVPCCPAKQVDVDTVFSTFRYDFSTEFIVHFRRLFAGSRSENELQNLLSVRPNFKDDFARMILLDFITRQDDRHLSNMAIKISKGREEFYPLYDNGRSLFYEDTSETVARAVADPVLYATTFGYSGTYWDYVQELNNMGVPLKELIDLSITKAEISDILMKSGFKGYRYEGALAWICKTLEMINAI